jgi:acyl carrier protein
MELYDEILEKLIQRTAQVLKKDPAELKTETRFVKDLKAKSVNMVQIITVLEDEFDVEIPFMQIKRKESIGETAEFIAELCSY